MFKATQTYMKHVENHKELLTARMNYNEINLSVS